MSEQQRPIFVVVVNGWIHKDGKFLLAQRSLNDSFQPGHWAIPGGKIEHTPGPDMFHKTLHREIMEEVNIKISDDIQHISSHILDVEEKPYHLLVVNHLCHRLSGEAEALDETEAIEWVTLDEVDNGRDLVWWIRDDIQKLRDLLQY